MLTLLETGTLIIEREKSIKSKKLNERFTTVIRLLNFSAEPRGLEITTA